MALDFTPKKLSISKVMRSPEIGKWASQFSNDNQKKVARLLLQQLEFVSIDQYSNWLLNTVNKFPNENSYAIYSVRKLDKDNSVLWDKSGEIVNRPGDSQGSEDLVYSLIARIVRSNRDCNKFFDHPSLEMLKQNKIHNIVLVDDSIGSGDRITKFINGMLSHPTFLSWWSYGLIHIHIISFARQRNVERAIVCQIRGSNSWKRKYPVSSKISFYSEKVYNCFYLEENCWGSQSFQIDKLCQEITVIPSKYRQGYVGVMANLVFHHSVPNNTPGMIWYDKPSKWDSLFPGRTLPNWTVSLLNDKEVLKQKAPEVINVDSELVQTLKLIKCGVRSDKGLAFRLNREIDFTGGLISKLIKAGFITDTLRITKAGLDFLQKKDKSSDLSIPNYSMYIPSSWCAD